MPIEPIKIPQNVYIEDRIVGPLTLRQIIMVAIGGGFSYAMWATINKAGAAGIIANVLVWIPAVLSVVFAFIKLNDLSMLKLILLMAEKINKPALRTWSPRRGLTINIRTFTTTTSKDKQNLAEALAKKEANRIDAISATLDRSEDAVNIEEETNPNVRVVDTVQAPPRPATNRPAITATPTREDAPMVDGVRPSVSIFTDITPPT